MSLMQHFIHRCTIVRPATAEDVYGRDVATGPREQTNVPCRLVLKQQTVVVSDIAERAVITRTMLLLAANVDIRHGDTVTVGTDGYVVSAILPRSSRVHHHTSCALERR